MDNEIQELKQEAVEIIMAYANGNPDVSRQMCITAARVLVACSDTCIEGRVF